MSWHTFIKKYILLIICELEYLLVIISLVQRILLLILLVRKLILVAATHLLLSQPISKVLLFKSIYWLKKFLLFYFKVKL